jgi:hypothetical protein
MSLLQQRYDQIEHTITGFLSRIEVIGRRYNRCGGHPSQDSLNPVKTVQADYEFEDNTEPAKTVDRQQQATARLEPKTDDQMIDMVRSWPTSPSNGCPSVSCHRSSMKPKHFADEIHRCIIMRAVIMYHPAIRTFWANTASCKLRLWIANNG